MADVCKSRFTFLELFIVVAVIGVLVALFRLQQTVERSRSEVFLDTVIFRRSRVPQPESGVGLSPWRFSCCRVCVFAFPFYTFGPRQDIQFKVTSSLRNRAGECVRLSLLERISRAGYMV